MIRAIGIAWCCLVLCLTGGLVLAADDVPAIVFPDLEGWVKGTRYNPPHTRATTIAFTTKAKVGGDYIRADVRVPKAGGKSLAQMLEALEEAMVANPVHKNTRKTGSREIKVSDKTTVTEVLFQSNFGGTPSERALYVFPYGDYFVTVEHSGPQKDAAARTQECMKLIRALVEAAEK